MMAQSSLDLFRLSLDWGDNIQILYLLFGLGKRITESLERNKSPHDEENPSQSVVAILA